MKGLQVAPTISLGEHVSATQVALLVLALIPGSCRAKCMVTESGPALSPKGSTSHIPWGQVRMPTLEQAKLLVLLLLYMHSGPTHFSYDTR